MINVQVVDGKENWIRAITEDFIRAMAAVPDSRQPRLCLAGGKTPEPVYRAISQWMVDGQAGRIPAIIIPGDERVPGSGQGPGDVQGPSDGQDLIDGQGLAATPVDLNETMLVRSFSRAIASGQAVLYGWLDDLGERVDGKPEADLALSMIQTMEARLAMLASSGHPLFDICYLGLGADGHTAGLFPDMPSLPGVPASRLCVSGLAPTPPRQRVSLGFAALASTLRTRFIISARGKEAALARLRDGDPSCPAVMAATTDAIAFVLA
jgi:6-phosphogluconolactonase/glucosamine-6-phosphate isomerase/deaminase